MCNTQQHRQAAICSKHSQAGNITKALVVVLLLVILGMCGGVYFLKKQFREDMNLLHDYVASLETQLGSKNATLQEFKGNLAKVAADSQSQDVILNDHLRTLEDNLTNVNERLKKVESRSHEDWLLSEVEYLLKMAEIRIAMKQDVKGAIQIMKSAEALIMKMPVEDAGLLTVRVSIAKDIASMEVYRNVDVPGTYAELVALGDQIEKLPLVPSSAPAAADANNDPAAKTAQPKMLSEINEALAGYITIRKHDTAELKALLSPEQRLNLRDSIRLTLEQAETGLLRGDQKIYDTSLAKLRERILTYFVADNFKVQIAAKKIDELAKVQVVFDLPSIAESQQELKRYVTDRMRLTEF